MLINEKKDIKLIHHLVLHKIKLDFSDQMFGYLWALINPLVYLFSYWFFAYVGFGGKNGHVGDIPFVVWFAPGVLVYRYMANVLSQSSTMLIKNGMLIKGSNINIKYYPLIEALKESYVHVCVMLAMFIIYAVLGYTMTGTWQYLPTVYYINFIYYWLVLFTFTSLLAYIFSVLGLFFRDVKNIIKSILVPLFWMTPVLFPVENGIKPVLEKVEMILNPFYYFIHGYRNTMVYGEFFIKDGWYNLYIWFILFTMAIIATKIWKFSKSSIYDLV